VTYVALYTVIEYLPIFGSYRVYENVTIILNVRDLIFRSEVHKNCGILGYYTVSSSNFYRCFGTTYRSSFQESWFCLEDEVDLLFRNVGKETPVYCTYCTRRAQFKFQTNNKYTL